MSEPTELPSWQTHRLGDGVPSLDQRPVGTSHLPAMRSGAWWPDDRLSLVEWELGLYDPEPTAHE